MGGACTKAADDDVSSNSHIPTTKARPPSCVQAEGKVTLMDLQGIGKTVLTPMASVTARRGGGGGGGSGKQQDQQGDASSLSSSLNATSPRYVCSQCEMFVETMYEWKRQGDMDDDGDSSSSSDDDDSAKNRMLGSGSMGTSMSGPHIHTNSYSALLKVLESPLIARGSVLSQQQERLASKKKGTTTSVEVAEARGYFGTEEPVCAPPTTLCDVEAMTLSDRAAMFRVPVQQFQDALFSLTSNLSLVLTPMVLFVAEELAVQIGMINPPSETPRAGRPTTPQQQQHRHRGGAAAMAIDHSIPDIVDEAIDAYFRQPYVRSMISEVSGVSESDAGKFTTDLCARAFKVLYLLTGGSATFVSSVDKDPTLTSHFTVGAIHHIWMLSRLGGFDGYEGMRTEEKTLDWLAGIRSLLVASGALPPTGRTEPYSSWVQHVPFFALTPESLQCIAYLHSIVDGQKRLVLAPVMRSAVLQSAQELIWEDSKSSKVRTSTIRSWKRPVNKATFKLYPLFAKEGVGIESGEGHGPRKEFFDLCAETFLSSTAPAIDISSAAVISMAGSSTIIVDWCDSSNAKNASLVPISSGDTLVISFGSSEVDEDVVVKTVKVISAVSTTSNGKASTRVTVNASLADLAELLIVATKVKKSCTPMFVQESGQLYCWVNPSLKSSEKATNANGFRMLGFLLGNAIANAMVLPFALPPLLFSILQQEMIDGTSFVSEFLAHNGDTAHFNPPKGIASLFNSSLQEAADLLSKVTQKEFEEICEAEGLSANGTTKEEYIKNILLKDTLFPTEETAFLLMEFLNGFAASNIVLCPLLRCCSCRTLRDLFCGLVDDGISDFDLGVQFRIQEDKELSAFPHSKRYRTIVFDVLNTTFKGKEKRELLKFITGRVYLPARPHAEHIKIEMPFSPMNSKEFDKLVSRLPSSHSCDNVLELPNYMEAILFGTMSESSDWYEKTGKRVGAVISEEDKIAAWDNFSQMQQKRIVHEVKLLLQEKLRLAVLQSHTYELDDGAVTAEHRDAYDVKMAAAHDGDGTHKKNGKREVDDDDDDSDDGGGRQPRLGGPKKSYHSPTKHTPVRRQQSSRISMFDRSNQDDVDASTSKAASDEYHSDAVMRMSGGGTASSSSSDHPVVLRKHHSTANASNHHHNHRQSYASTSHHAHHDLDEVENIDDLVEEFYP